MPEHFQCDNRPRTQQEQQTLVFEEFAKVCPLPLDIATISSPPPPEPDIFVHCQDGSALSFEMVEVTNLPLRKTISDSRSIEAQIHKEVRALPDNEREEILRRCGGTAVDIRFPKELTKPKKIALIPQILERLRCLPTDHEGRLFHNLSSSRGPRRISIGICRIPELRENQIDFLANRSTLARPNLIPEITKKLKKARKGGYTPRAPMELLGWSVASVSSSWSEHEIKELLRQELGASGFRRVWLFGRGETGIFFIYPPLESR